jgi:DHA1 family 2-module integral membrane pump EmrD-like MFS transporter
MPEIRFISILVLVAGLACVGQMTNTIYVPAMTMIGSDLQVTPGVVQAVMGLYLFSYGASQFIHGPLSDWFGRRPIVLIGLVVFIVGSIIAATAPAFIYLLIGSFIQGIGTGVGGMMVRTAMRDLYTGRQLHTASSYMSATLIVAPLIAPVLGAVLSSAWGWRANFVFLTVMASVILVMQYYFLPETNRYVKQPQTQLKLALRTYKVILSDFQFQGYMACLLATFAGVSVIEAVIGLLFGNVLHYNTHMVSFLFITPLPAYLFGSFLAARFNRVLTLNQIIFKGIFWLAVGSFSMLWAGLMGHVTLVGILLPAIIFFFGAGILFPTATAGALEPFAESAGKAGALLGGIQNLGSGICALISAMLPQHTQVPLGWILAVLTLLVTGIFFSFIGLRERTLQNV